MPVTVDIPIEKWKGVVREITIGATKEQGGTRAAEAKGADLILLKLNATLADGGKNTASNAKQVTRSVLNATGLPLMVFGPGQAEIDNELLVAVAEEAKGEKIVLGLCEDKNYRTLVAAAL